MKYIATSMIALALAASGLAEQHDSPWAVRLGPVFPRISSSDGVSVKPGASFGVSYRAYRTDTMSLEIESLASSYSLSAGGDSATVSVSNLNLVALFHSPNSTLYYGAVAGYASPSATIDGYKIDGKESFAYGPVIGTKLSGGWFVEARYVLCDIPASRGTMVLAGYRF